MKKLAAGLLVLVANAAYLAAREDATLFYFGNVLLHLALGTILTGAAAVVLPRAWPRLGFLLRAAMPGLVVG
ncbi:MAG TPA: hypothetical protein VN083_03755, partial [Vicinamibacteria bacterium]|nr:hypothetical protein [Vicinamibacteria bacterium]